MKVLLAAALIAGAFVGRSAAADEPAPLTAAERRTLEEAARHQSAGLRLARRGELAGAETALLRALELRRAVPCPPELLIASHDHLASVLERRERFPFAVRARADSLALREKHYGPDSPEHGIGEANLGASYRKSGQFIESIAHYERAKATLSKSGDTHAARIAGIDAILAGLRAPLAEEPR